MPSDFVHLHLHTDYSLLDGATAFEPPDKHTPAPLPTRLKEFEMGACAITDHGFMGGCINFYTEFTKAGLKPIIGCEMYVSSGSRFDRSRETKHMYHLVLLAKDWEGYQNLCHLMTRAYMEGFYYKPRIDHELLGTYNKNIIALSACINGEIPAAFLNGNDKYAYELADKHIQWFGRENFFIEVQDHGIPEERIVNPKLFKMARELNLKVVATNDVHYLKKEHARAHDILLCIGTKAKINDTNRLRFTGEEFYLKTEDEMRALFPDHPEAITNTRLVAEMCNIFIPLTDNNKDLNHYPVYSVDKTRFNTQGEYLRELCLQGIPERYNFDPRKTETEWTPFEKEVMERLNFELGIIDRMGFSSYYLVVWDFLKFARDHKIPVGPGRGSGAGSIAAYLVHITDIEPLRFNLFFERFLNPERVSPPDFDIDFCERRRGEVIEYVREKYGADSVAQIGTYGTLKPKAAIKDVARVLGKLPSVADRITKTIAGSPDVINTKTLEENPDFKLMLDVDPETQEIVREATPLFNLNRNMTIHAAGVIIGDQPLDNVVPLAKGANGEIITQFSSVPCEHMGLLKMDFLGLRTLTILQDAVDYVKEARGLEINLSTVPLDDPLAYELIGRGDTVAVFQLESVGMRKLCRRLNPTKLEEIIALIALYRPGPMKFIDQYIEGQKNPEKVVYAHPALEEICRETYGIMVYQEQVMEAARRVAGYSLGGADMLRRAMGKKKPEEMAKQRSTFVKGAAELHGLSEEKAGDIFSILEKFAEYGFNKSHSAAYAVVAYRTAYMKANYPVEFMAAVLTGEVNHADKLRFFINECHEMNIAIKGPDINKSGRVFGVDGDTIRFGFSAIKGVGDAASGGIIEVRKESGPYKDFADFCDRTMGKTTESTIQSLIRAGAFDSFGAKRSQLLAILPDMLRQAKMNSKDRDAGQDSFFDLLGSDDADTSLSATIPLPDIPELDEAQMLKDEDELLGFWLSGHPLAKYERIIQTYSTQKIFEITANDNAEGEEEDPELANNNEPREDEYTAVRVAGLIRSVQRKTSKTGRQFYIFDLDDMTGRMEIACFEKLLNRPLQHLAPDGMPPETLTSQLIQQDGKVLVEGFIRRNPGSPSSITAERIIPLEHVSSELSKEIHLHFFEKGTDRDVLGKISALCDANPGKARVILCIKTVEDDIVFIETAEQKSVRPSIQFIADCRAILGTESVRLVPDDKLSTRKLLHFQKKDKPEEGNPPPNA